MRPWPVFYEDGLVGVLVGLEYLQDHGELSHFQERKFDPLPPVESDQPAFLKRFVLRSDSEDSPKGLHILCAATTMLFFHDSSPDLILSLRVIICIFVHDEYKLCFR